MENVTSNHAVSRISDGQDTINFFMNLQTMIKHHFIHKLLFFSVFGSQPFVSYRACIDIFLSGVLPCEKYRHVQIITL